MMVYKFSNYLIIPCEHIKVTQSIHSVIYQSRVYINENNTKTKSTKPLN